MSALLVANFLCLLCLVPTAQDQEAPFMQQEVMETPSFHPRGFQPHRFQLPSIDFPPAYPNGNNIENICLYQNQRPTYGPESLPPSGFGHLHRQLDAIKHLEAGFATCCQQPVKLNCAQALWRDVLKQFCRDEFSVKTRHYSCCKKTESERDSCFEENAPSPSYLPSDVGKESLAAGASVILDSRNPPICPLQDPSQCHSTVTTSQEIPKVSFPPGEPNQSNIQNVCKLRKFRPRYSQDSLPSSGFSWLRRQMKAVNKMEVQFKNCCKNTDVLSCAQNKWREALDEFCEQEFSVKDRSNPCCKKQGTEKYSCFAERAPHPNYDKEIQTIDLGNMTAATMEIVCAHVKVFTKQTPIPMLLKSLKKNCCSLPAEENIFCAEDKKEEIFDRMCTTKKKFWADPERCCSDDALARTFCFNLGYLGDISVVTSSGRAKGKRRSSGIVV
ncbi:extracellular matrix protein 1 isoform X2 [Latimeria chalumnae]|uniref:extracellular matrix protein 1 isoform X2 n=1 Tax=Latimeria chalumnae TaxID=7897 RepID=UPI0003C0FEC6|nr:PREDICTED: extracellular matrix protein 1 isoform X2 [Latimeria chalumnae]|eukprot:XP_006006139.1 PREDICTED: extracellular matrix protein 1 isoform X2 [Latimeria chalumnae]